MTIAISTADDYLVLDSRYHPTQLGSMYIINIKCVYVVSPVQGMTAVRVFNPLPVTSHFKFEFKLIN